MTDDYQLGIYEKALPADLSWEERLDAVNQGGFDYLEMSVDETDARLARLEWNPFRRKALVRAMGAMRCEILDNRSSGWCLDVRWRCPLQFREVTRDFSFAVHQLHI